MVQVVFFAFVLLFGEIHCLDTNSTTTSVKKLPTTPKPSIFKGEISRLSATEEHIDSNNNIDESVEKIMSAVFDDTLSNVELEEINEITKPSENPTTPQNVSNLVRRRSSKNKNNTNWDYRCQLQPYIGKCNKHKTRYYYDVQLDKCFNFSYSGCKGNKNNFHSLAKCEQHCLGAAYMNIGKLNSSSYCPLQASPGLCFAAVAMYYYDINLSNCTQFTYGGCNGNQNNFKTHEECYNVCHDYNVKPVKSKAIATDTTRATVKTTTTKVSAKTETTTKSSFRAIGQKSSGEFDITAEIDRAEENQKSAESNKVVKNDTADTTVEENDTSEKDTTVIKYTLLSHAKSLKHITPANNNKAQITVKRTSVLDKEITIKHITPKINLTTVDNVEELKPDTSIEYNNTEKIESDIGNIAFVEKLSSNDSDAYSSMENDTAKNNETIVKNDTSTDNPIAKVNETTDGSRVIVDFSDKSDSNSIEELKAKVQDENLERRSTYKDNKTDWDYWCQMQPKSGKCHQHEMRYYYDIQLDKCMKFTYSGCKGNKNNFETKSECENHCLGAAYIDLGTLKSHYYCALQVSPGSCLGMVPMYYYDINQSGCKSFTYGGCNGNQNNFKSAEECNNYCHDYNRHKTHKITTEKPVTSIYT